ncbi:MAG TPA: protein kinase [Myxococcaceae bacterium]|jgi:serine/threonine-protein kinase
MTASAHGPSALSPDQSIDGWRIVEELGAGSFSSVYRVEKGGLFFALKLAHHRTGGSRERKRGEERTQRELECLLALRHPNIARVWGHGRWPHPPQGQVYLVLDYVDGFTLGQWKEKCAPTPHEIVVLFEQIAEALAYMHERGVKHRDLKPANIMVGRQDRMPVIVDYGAADRTGAESLTDERLPPGTPRHTSPEALRFDREHRADPHARYEYQIADEIYAFGVTLYDVLTVALLDSAPQYLPVTSEVMEPRPAHRVNPRVPVALSELTAQLISRDPAQRPVDFEVVRRKLAELRPLQGEEWHGKPIDPPSQTSMASAGLGPTRERATGLARHLTAPWRLLRGGVGIASVGLLLVLALGLALLLRWGTREHAPPQAQQRHGPNPPVADTSPLAEVKGTEGAPLPPEQPSVVPPALRSAQDSAPSMKGRPVKKADAAGSSVPSICSRKEPPPATQPALLREWCRCAGLAGALALTAACTGLQPKPSGGRCPDEVVRSMEALGIDAGDLLGTTRLDETTSGEGLTVYKDGPITSVVEAVDVKYLAERGLVVGTQLRGEVWTGPFMLEGKNAFYIRYTQIRLPGGNWQPVCAVAGAAGIGLLEWEEGSKPGAVVFQKSEITAVAVTGRWPWP